MFSCVFSYRLRLPAFVLVDVCNVESIYHHIKSWLPLYERLEALQLLKTRNTERERDALKRKEKWRERCFSGKIEKAVKKNNKDGSSEKKSRYSISSAAVHK